MKKSSLKLLNCFNHYLWIEQTSRLTLKPHLNGKTMIHLRGDIFAKHILTIFTRSICFRYHFGELLLWKFCSRIAHTLRLKNIQLNGIYCKSCNQIRIYFQNQIEMNAVVRIKLLSSYCTRECSALAWQWLEQSFVLICLWNFRSIPGEHIRVQRN